MEEKRRLLIIIKRMKSEENPTRLGKVCEDLSNTFLVLIQNNQRI
tara:strand:+ start:125022 stop:125156 length:135 start_codon:yes stop_codon:yes gene_type:complete